MFSSEPNLRKAHATACIKRASTSDHNNGNDVVKHQSIGADVGAPVFVLCRSPRTRMRTMCTVLSNATAMGLNALAGKCEGECRQGPRFKPRGASRPRCILRLVRLQCATAKLFYAYTCPPKKILKPGRVPRNLLRGDEAPSPSSQKNTCFGLMTSVHETSTGTPTKQLKQLERRCRQTLRASACEADGLSLRGLEPHRCRMSRVLSTRLLP